MNFVPLYAAWAIIDNFPMKIRIANAIEMWSLTPLKSDYGSLSFCATVMNALVFDDFPSLMWTPSNFQSHITENFTTQEK